MHVWQGSLGSSGTQLPAVPAACGSHSNPALPPVLPPAPAAPPVALEPPVALRPPVALEPPVPPLLPPVLPEPPPPLVMPPEPPVLSSPEPTTQPTPVIDRARPNAPRIRQAFLFIEIS